MTTHLPTVAELEAEEREERRRALALREEPAYVSFVLDRTGSMSNIYGDTIGGFNTFVEDLKRSATPILFTLMMFAEGREELICDMVPVAQAPELNTDNYRPSGSTNLIDACYEAIHRAAILTPYGARVSIVIQTDGEENASRKYTWSQLRHLVREKQDQGWIFTFLGAGIDAFAQGSKAGFLKGTTLNYAGRNSQQAFRSAARSTVSYCAAESSAEGQLRASFTDEERAEAIGKLGTGRKS